jgi:hypothetical protein
VIAMVGSGISITSWIVSSLARPQIEHLPTAGVRTSVISCFASFKACLRECVELKGGKP